MHTEHQTKDGRGFRVRSIALPEDREAVLRLDTSMVTSERFRIDMDGARLSDGRLGVLVAPEPLPAPLQKTFPLGGELGDEHFWQERFVAEFGNGDGPVGPVAGFLALRHERWNRRMVIWHLYVDREARGLGVGGALLDAAERSARSAKCWCLWLEVTNVNVPAIRFYESQGFAFVGFDRSLYDPEGEAGTETALYMTRDVGSSSRR
ncbi:MAG: N-acetyltransferase [Candidatus Eisenbacteria bacterium]